MRFKLAFVLISFFVVEGILTHVQLHDASRRSALPGNADLIVCMAFSDDRADRAVELLGQGGGRKIVATTRQTYDALLERRVRREQVILLAPDAETTYQEGVLLRKYLQDSRSARVLVVSDGVHLFRVGWTLDHLFQKDTHRFWLFASDRRPTSLSSWNERLQLKSRVYELIAVVYYWLGHGVFGIEKNPFWIDAVKELFVSDTCVIPSSVFSIS